MAKPNVCTVCKKMLKAKNITFEGKKFCCQTCCSKFKESKKKKVCDFC